MEVCGLLSVELAVCRAAVLGGSEALEAVVDELGVLLVEILVSHHVRRACVDLVTSHLRRPEWRLRRASLTLLGQMSPVLWLEPGPWGSVQGRVTPLNLKLLRLTQARKQSKPPVPLQPSQGVTAICLQRVGLWTPHNFGSIEGATF